MADDTKERCINPYTDFGFKKLFGTGIARYSETERRQYKDSKKKTLENTTLCQTKVVADYT